MSAHQEIEEIIAQYQKFGWTPRIRLSPRNEIEPATATLERMVSDLNAIWFSRTSRPGAETWELRRLEGTAYARLAFIGDEMTTAEKRAALQRVENAMRDDTKSSR